VFGIRYGRYWTLYLQKNAVFETLKFHRQTEVNPDGTLKGTGERTTYQQARDVFEPRKLGPITLKDKRVKVYSTSVMHALPMELVEIYPNRSFSANLKTTFKRAG
jgi:hypothetical protein